MAPINLSAEQACAIVQATTFDVFNEHDASKRRQLMEKYWAPGVTCFSPFGIATGYDALDQVWAGLHADEKSTWIFSRSGDLWLDFNLIMQPWVYGPPEAAEPAMKGWDVIHVDEDGKVHKLYALIEGMSTHVHTA
ncbi:hypothetical protein V8E51_008349 [Hyaloscypha variabilis]|uniref:SnoaL-like domain-containing protein n=1 Tax=Hyaloscypha variabilis (strain UAMH 11265 / GT02V1 / F) TaxID=1149755 RepID=A0A2J6S161_HYAVF|nr:hypothetical protein L207DRAFT_525830 [Hyaloscypha variabilis F]